MTGEPVHIALKERKVIRKKFLYLGAGLTIVYRNMKVAVTLTFQLRSSHYTVFQT